MKLVETDIETPPRIEREAPAAPPPVEHRRVAVSFFLTAAVLIATVVSIYVVFPARHNALLSSAVSLHAQPGEFDLETPDHDALVACSIPLVGKGVPWPKPAAGLAILGVRQTRVLSRRAAVVRYRIAGEVVTLLVTRARDTPPRTHRRHEGDALAISWRRTKWTFVAVGSAEHRDAWRSVLGAP